MVTETKIQGFYYYIFS